MKQRVARLSPHQNAKVFAVLTAVVALVFSLPIFLIANALSPAESHMPALAFLFIPVIYLVLTYISVALGCAVYNFTVRYTGGIEFEAQVGNI